jgi:Fe-Mn family superoxide dismutase
MIEKVNFTYTNEITAINKEQFDAHIRLYEGYVNNINKIDAVLQDVDAQRDHALLDHALLDHALLEQANTTFSYYRELKRGETFALDGVILHELYFENLGGNQEPDQQVIDILEKDFGSFRNWQEDFVATAKASRGWAMLAYDQRSERYRNISLDAHDHGIIAYSAPVLILDMYEHAYFLQYADKKADYINNFMKNINWTIVGRRMNFNC